MSARHAHTTRLTHWALVMLLLLAWAVRLAWHDVHGLEGDDAHTLHLLANDYATLWEGLRNQSLDAHPPLHFFLLKTWAGVAGDSLLALRLYNVLLDMLTGACLLITARRAFNLRAMLMAGILWLCAPLLLYGLYPIRMYVPLGFFVTATVALLVIGRKKPLASLWGASLLALCAVYTHIYGAFVLAGVALYGLLMGMTGRMTARQMALGWVGVGVAGVLFLPFGLPILDRYLAGDALGATVGGLPVPAHEMAGLMLQVMLGHHALGAPLIGYGLLAGLVFIVWRLRQRPPALPVLVVFVVAFLGMLSLALASDIYRPRYLAPFLPLLLVLIAGALSMGRRRALGLWALLLVSGAGIVGNFAPIAYDDWRATADFIARHEREGDVIIVVPAWGARAFDYHYEGTLPVQALLSGVDAHTELDGVLSWASQGAQRVWLVRYQVGVSDPLHRVPAWFDERAVLLTEAYPTAIHLRGYALLSEPDAPHAAMRPINATFDERLRVAGVWLPITSGQAHDRRWHPPANRLRLSLALEALAPLPDVTLRVRLADGFGATWGATLDYANGFWQRYPLEGWRTGQLYEAFFDINLNPDAPAGIYNVEVMLLKSDGTPLPATGTDAGAFWAIVGQFTVK